MSALRRQIRLRYRLWARAAAVYPKAPWQQHLYLFAIGALMPNLLLKAYINPRLRYYRSSH